MTDNSDINEISDINSLIELYHKEGKEALEVSKKLDAINVRFGVIRDRITALRHLTEDKSDDEEETNINEVVEKVVKVKKVPVKKVVKKEVVKKEEVKPEVKEEEEKELEEIEKEDDSKSKVVEKEVSKKATRGRKKK
jgi:hypothetical protein